MASGRPPLASSVVATSARVHCKLSLVALTRHLHQAQQFEPTTTTTGTMGCSAVLWAEHKLGGIRGKHAGIRELGKRTYPSYKRAYRPGRRRLRCRSQAALQQRSPPPVDVVQRPVSIATPMSQRALEVYVGVAENARPRWRVGAVAFMQKPPGTVCPCRYLCNLQVEAGLQKCAVAGSGAAIHTTGARAATAGLRPRV